MPDHNQRLRALRAALSEQCLDGFILATGDEHITEFPAPYAQRLAWLTGFTGSTASIAVLAGEAAIFVDSRYTGSVRSQVDGADWSYEDVPQTSIGAWLADHAAGLRIGYDPKLYTRTALGAIADKLAGKAELVPVATNPIDPLWADQPARPLSPVFVQPLARAGKSSAEKRRAISEWLGTIDADACVLTALDSIAWLFNIRASDVNIVPLAYSFAICHRDGTADLFVDPRKIDDAVRQHLGNSVRLFGYDDFHAALAAMPGQRVSLDPNLTPVAIYSALETGGATIRADRDPAVLPKAMKNAIEVEGMKQAHIRDGAALTRFLHWFAREAPKGQLTELAAAAKLNRFREETEGYHSLSFDPISAVDGNGAIPHYWPTPESDAPIGPDSIYLIDSGGQYPDGTTDVTRTVAVGQVRSEVRDRFTRVLKGNIALQTTLFPTGTMGSRLDAIARTALWAGGVECAHSIGHGVGAFLNVHEGPAYFGPFARPGEAPLEAGMILSNEPGYYKAGDYGIRIENLMVVVEAPVAGGDRPMLGFEAITVRATIGPLLSAPEREWLERQTAPIREAA
jgi:Xaa-Pro aminopeptidase